MLNRHSRQDCQDLPGFPDNPARAYIQQNPNLSLSYFLNEVRARTRKQDCQGLTVAGRS